MASTDIERGGDKVADHTAWVLGRRFFGLPLFSYVFFVKYHGVRLGRTFGPNMPTTSDCTGGLTGGGIFTTPFVKFLGKFTNCRGILPLCSFFPPRRNTPKIISRNAGQRKTKRHMRQSRRVSRARPMAAPQGTGSTRVTSRVIPGPAWLVAESAVLHESSFRPVDRVNSPT